AVDQQDWDPSVKALTQFPSVLANLDKDLSWTSELGDANLNQQADVMQAIQFMRKKAQEAGNLKTTPQQTVADQGSDVIIQPADPNVVYVPDYDPELIYGYPVGLWPGFYPWWGVGGPYLSFGVGFGIGPFFGFGWGWHGWGLDWYHRGLLYGGGPYAFHSHAFYDRNAYFHGNYRGGRLSRAAVPALVVLALQEEAVRARAPVPLADSATAETRGVFPREDSPASVEACMAVAEVDTEKQALTLGLTWAGPRGKE
ncbi:MAG: DUF3300 domain-containing protein, partial [Candidatus Sulfotelmatobacter sp.]